MNKIFMNKNNALPRLHMSHLELYLLFSKTSGAMYNGVPIPSVMNSFSSNFSVNRAKPKSAILAWPL